MLVLGRRVNQAIWIGDAVRVVVTRIGTDQVKLGIDAPNGVSVDREEIRERKRTSGSTVK